MDGGRDGLQPGFWSAFGNLQKPFAKRFHLIYADVGVREARSFRCGGTSHEQGCLNLNCLKSVSIVAGKNLNSIVGQRSNKLHEGGTSSNCLLNVAKPEFCKFTMLSLEQKAVLLGDSLCRDASRCKQDVVVGQGSDEPLSYASMSHNLLILGLTLRWQT